MSFRVIERPPHSLGATRYLRRDGSFVPLPDVRAFATFERETDAIDAANKASNRRPGAQVLVYHHAQSMAGWL